METIIALLSIALIWQTIKKWWWKRRATYMKKDFNQAMRIADEWEKKYRDVAKFKGEITRFRNDKEQWPEEIG